MHAGAPGQGVLEQLPQNLHQRSQSRSAWGPQSPQQGKRPCQEPSTPSNPASPTAPASSPHGTGHVPTCHWPCPTMSSPMAVCPPCFHPCHCPTHPCPCPFVPMSCSVSVSPHVPTHVSVQCLYFYPSLGFFKGMKRNEKAKIKANRKAFPCLYELRIHMLRREGRNFFGGVSTPLSPKSWSLPQFISTWL